MKIKHLTPLLFILIVFAFLGYQRQHKPRIFILHSYNANMPWVENLNKGIRSIFADKAYISLRYFYMDTKRHHSQEYLDRINKSVKTMIAGWQPDVLIAFDDDAQNMAVHEFGNSPTIKVILAGITDSKRWLEYENTPNVTGVTERIPVKAIREILTLMFEKPTRIYYLSDNSTAAKTLDKSIVEENWGSYELVAHKRVETFKQWQDAVHEAEEKADILLISVYHTITDGNKQVRPSRLVRWMNSHSHIPVVGIYESFIIDGGLLAIAISSLEQGYTAAWLGLNIIEKKLTIQKTPLLHGKTFSLFIQKDKLLRQFPNIHIPVILDAFSNSPFSIDSINSSSLDLFANEQLFLKTSSI